MQTLSQQARYFEHQHDDAQDLLQDVLLLMLEKINSFHGGNFEGWAYTLMYNLYRNRQRHLKTATNALLHIGLPSHTHYSNSSCHYDITRTIELLPHCYRNAIAMYIEGYRYEEIALHLDISLGTVKSRIARARNIMQQHLIAYRQ